MKALARVCLAVFAVLNLQACDTVVMVLEDRYGDPLKRYANATEPQGLIEVKRQYSFRFLDRWRVSHGWLSGTNVRNCRYGRNSYKRLGGYGELERETHAPFVEHDGILGQLIEHKGQWEVSTPFEKVYGTAGRNGIFERYTAFCGQAFLSSRNGFGLYIVKPDPAKGTNEWIEGAKAVQLNGSTWLVKQIAPRDMTGSPEGLADTIEIWTLPIPDTPYWLTLKFSASLEYSIQQRFAQNLAMHGLFREIVASVRLEPISSVTGDLRQEADGVAKQPPNGG